MFRRFTHGAFAAVLAVALLPTTLALAKPVAWQSIDVTRHTDDGITLIAGTLPTSVDLPAEAELIVPAGSQLQWIGEILGGPASDDPALRYTKSTAGGSDIYRFTVEKSRTAQIELNVPVGETTEASGTRSTLEWTAFADVAEVTLGARIPGGASIVEEAEGAEYSAIDGDAGYYSKVFTKVKRGDVLALTFVFQPAPAPVGGSPAAAADHSNTIMTFVLAMLAAGFGVILTLIFTQRNKARLTAELEAQRAPAEKPASRSRSKAIVEEAFDDEEDAEEDEAAAQPIRPATRADEVASETVARAPRSGAAIARNIVTLGLLGVLVVVGIIIGSEVSKPKVVGDTISQTFSSGQPCDKAQYLVTAPAGSDPVKVAQKLFAALKPVDGMNTAAYNISSTTLNVDFCGSKTSEPAVTQALRATGMVTGTSAGAPASAE